MESDAATTVLTGQLPFVVLVGATIAFPLSLLLLKRYTKSVVRTMAASGGANPVARSIRETETAAGTARELEMVRTDTSSVLASGSPGSVYYNRAIRAPWATVSIYAFGGVAYAVVLAAAQLISDGSFSLLGFVVMTFIYAWPVVIAINLIVPSTKRVKIRSVGGYFAMLITIFVVAVAVSPSMSVLDLFVAWGLFSLPPTILLLLFLHSRIRAVGPMVLTFTVISVTGANVAIAVVASSDTVLGVIVGAATAIDSNAIGVFVAIIIVGLAIFGVFGWFANEWIKKLYLGKRLSDQSLALDAMWFFFATIQSIGLAFVNPAWYSAGLVAFLVYKITVMAGFKSSASANGRPAAPINLLFLRVFSLGKRSEQVFDAISAHWRYLGSVRMIAGPDLAVTTVEPHEFLEYLSGKIDQAFIANADVLERRIAELDSGVDFDGRYRVNDFFCYDDTWKMVLSRLVKKNDAVFMDVRGFSPNNAGVVFELNELINVVPLERVVLAFDQTTDTAFLNNTIKQLWASMRTDSPNRRESKIVLRLCEVTAEHDRDVLHVLRSLCNAASASTGSVALGQLSRNRIC